MYLLPGVSLAWVKQYLGCKAGLWRGQTSGFWFWGPGSFFHLASRVDKIDQANYMVGKLTSWWCGRIVREEDCDMEGQLGKTKTNKNQAFSPGSGMPFLLRGRKADSIGKAQVAHRTLHVFQRMACQEQWPTGYLGSKPCITPTFWLISVIPNSEHCSSGTQFATVLAEGNASTFNLVISCILWQS